MTNIALIATTIAADGARTLARSDCAAIQSAVEGDANAIAICPAGDRGAIEYAHAAGVRDIQALEASPPAEFDIAYAGSGAVELLGDIFLARWAEASHATLLFDVLRCFGRGEEVHEVECDAGRGARHVITVDGPLILVLSSHVARPAYVSRYRRRVATAQASVSGDADHDHGLHRHQWGPVRPRVRVRRGADDSTADDRMNSAFSIQSKAQNESSSVIAADPETCARQLLRYLAHNSFVTRPDRADNFSLPDARQRSHQRPEPRVPKEAHSVFELTAYRQRRPRQPADSSTRLARQPRPLGTRVFSNDRLSAFNQRRPRQGNDSLARRARQPRPITME